MDCEIKRCDFSITLETYNDLEKLAKRQNSHIGNVADRILREGIAETYKRWPNLKETP